MQIRLSTKFVADVIEVAAYHSRHFPLPLLGSDHSERSLIEDQGLKGSTVIRSPLLGCCGGLLAPPQASWSAGQ
jgi:hypothetical protein